MNIDVSVARALQKSASSSAPAWEFAAQTHAGRVRKNNEDALSFNAELGLAILADGMGGYNAGEVASGMAVALIEDAFGRWLTHAGAAAPLRAVDRAIQRCVADANRVIFEAGSANQQLRGMGTTLVMAAFDPQRAVVGHIGDSRCYRLRQSQLSCLTRDHSLLQERLDAGALSQEQAAVFPYRNLVTRALGIEKQVEAEIVEHTVESGDLFLLCSDGLNEMLSDEQIAVILSQNVSIDQKASQLVSAANDNGGKDNISVLLAQAAATHFRSEKRDR